MAFDANAAKLRLCTGTTWVNIDTSATAVATPGGSDTQVQFNDGGSLGGDAGLTYNKTTDTLTGSVGSFATMTTSTKFYGANGTAANPAYVFTNANDTGLYLPAAGVLGLSVAGTEYARVTSAGVSTTGYVSGTAFYSTDSNAYFYNDLATPSLVMDSGSDFFGFTRAQNRYDFNIGGTSYARVTTSGISSTYIYSAGSIAAAGALTTNGNITVDSSSGSGGVNIEPYDATSYADLRMYTDLGDDDYWRFLAYGNSYGTTSLRRNLQLVYYTAGVANTIVAIEYDGYVGIGVTDPTYAIELPNAANVTGRGRANQWAVYSDKRFKTNLAPVDHALDKVMKLKGVYYDSVEGKYPEKNQRQLGFLAQDVKAVVPEVVDVTSSVVIIGDTSRTVPDYHSMSYDRLTALLVEAVKELKADNDALTERVKQLETHSEHHSESTRH